MAYEKLLSCCIAKATSLFPYLPWIALSTLGYIYSNNFIVVAVLICVWKCIGYSEIIYHNFVRENKKPICIVLLCIGIVSYLFYAWTDNKLFPIVNVYIFSIMREYAQAHCVNEKACKENKLIGLVIAGILLSNKHVFSFFMLLLINIYFLAIVHTKDLSLPQSGHKKQEVADEINYLYAVIEFLHNFIYYMAFPYFPLLGLVCFRVNPLDLGFIFCIANWILFVEKEPILKEISKTNLLTQNEIIALGFFLSAITYIGIYKSIHFYIIILLTVLQGAFGGISESFWSHTFKNYNGTIYINCWKIGGILGSIVGGIIILWYRLQTVFLVCDILSVLTSVLVVFNNRRQK